MNARIYTIAADIQTTAPMHITAIEKGSYDPKSRTIYRYDGPGIGCGLTRTTSVQGAAIPVIPASTVAGKLRHAAADLIFSSLVQRGLVLSPNAYNTMTSGSANTDLNADAATPESARAARRDPFLSLFGGTSFAMSAGSVISEGWPLLEKTKGQLMSPPIMDVATYEKLSEMTEAVAIVRKNDVASLQGRFLEDVVGVVKLAEYAQAETNARVASKARKSAGDQEKKTDLRTLNAIETVCTGLGFALRVQVTARTPAHLGLMLLAFQEFLRAGQVGGKGNRGMGTFVCTASRLYEVDPKTRKATVVGTIFSDKASGYETFDNAVVVEAITGAQDYLDAANPLLYEAFASADAKTIKQLQAA